LTEQQVEYLLEMGTPDFIKTEMAPITLKSMWALVQCELILSLFCFNAIVKILKRGESAEAWAYEHNFNIGNFVSIANKRAEIIENMIQIGLSLNNNIETNNVQEYITGLKRAIHTGYIANTLKLVPETRGKYQFKYIYSRGQGVDNFKIKFDKSINDMIYEYIEDNEFPNEIISFNLTIEESRAKDKGMAEWRPMAEFVSFL